MDWSILLCAVPFLAGVWIFAWALEHDFDYAPREETAEEEK